MTYIPGDWWAICQKTGIKFRISELREEPTKDNPNSGLWVYSGALDPVHPQEYVRGVEDDPSVPLSFPDVPTVVGETTLVFDTPKYSRIVVIPHSSIAQYDPIGITMDDSMVFWDFVETYNEYSEPGWDVNGEIMYAADGLWLGYSTAYDTIIISQDIWTLASAGNTVYLPSLDNEEWQ